MSQPSGAEKTETHPVKLAIAVGVGTVSLIVGIVLLASYAVGTHFIGADTKAMSAEEVSKRIAPVARLVTDPASAQHAAAPAKEVIAAKPATAGGKADGKTVYAQSCAVCHATGVAGAPKLGDKGAWGPRISAGVEALRASVVKGKNAMPPKGGNAALSDSEINAAVEYLLSQVK